MSDVPSNLIPTRITQLPVAPVADENSLMMIVYQGNNYQIRVGDLLSVAGVPTSRQVIAGTGLSGGGQLISNVTLSIAPGGVGNTELAATGVAAGSYGSATAIPVFTVDAKGRVTSASSVPVTVSGYVPTSRQVIAGTGLTGGGPLNANVTLNADLSNSTPLPTDGFGTPGTAATMSRSDHQHPSINLQNADEVDGLLPLNRGGTARSMVMDAGAIIWSGADGLYVGPVGALGQALISGGTSAPTWSDVVYSVNGYTGVVTLTYADVGAPATDGTDATGTWNISITGTAANATSATTATNLAGGAANRLAYQSAPGTTTFAVAPTDPDTFLKWSGSAFTWGTIAGAGTVTSVGLALPAEFTVSNSPVNSSGTLTGAWANETANYIFAGPATGSPGTPTFRAMVAGDVPTLNQNTTGQAGSVANAVTFNSSGGASPNTSYDGSAARTIDYSTVGAPKADGTGASGTWSISINGNAATATSATTATNLAGGASGSLPYQSAAGTTAMLAKGSDGQFLTLSSGVPAWTSATLNITDDTTTNTAYYPLWAKVTSGTTNTEYVSSTKFTFNPSSGDLTTTTWSGDFIDLNTGATVTPAVGRLWWDGGTTLNVGMTANVTGQVAETLFIYVKASAAISKGDVVVQDGSVGASGVLKAKPAPLATSNAVTVLGIAAENLALNAFGLIQVRGYLRGFDTTGSSVGETWADGDLLYYNPAYVGGLTKVKPTAPNIKLPMCEVVNAAAGASGEVLVIPGQSSVLGGTDSNVQFGSLSNGDVIVYDSVATYWKNVAQSTLTVGAATNIAGGAQGSLPYQTGSGATSFLAKDTNATRYLSNTGTSNNPAWAQIDLSNGVTGTLPIANGGTNATATPTAGAISYGSGTAYAFTSAGTSGQVLTSAGAGTPTWTTATNLNTASAIVQRDASGDFSAGTITAALTGNASSATNIGITDDTSTNATMYPLWVTANTGNLPAKVTSTKLSFNPSSGVLTVTGGISGGTF